MRVVLALGGNALLRRGEDLDPALQERRVARAADAVASVARRHDVVVTHGNGPQVGLLALQSESHAPHGPAPLDQLGAQTEGMIGYLIERELRGRLPGRQVATLLTQVTVDPGDPAFDRPQKPIGPSYAREDAERLTAERGFAVEREGERYRRVVASPEPCRILELETIRLLLDAGVLVVCAGGGGIPVVEMPGGGLRGVEAVIDKDLAASLLATKIDADALLLLTDVEAVYLDWRDDAPPGRPLARCTPEQLRGHDFAPGSMGPKVEAACRFVERGGAVAAIGRLEDAEALLDGRVGTRVSQG